MKYLFLLYCLMVSGCVGLPTPYLKEVRNTEKLSQFQFMQKECLNCSRALLYEIDKKIFAVNNSNQIDAKYLVEIYIEIKKDHFAKKINSIALRDKSLFILKYSVLDKKNQRLILQDNLLEIENKYLSSSPMRDFGADEEISISMMRNAFEELEYRLVIHLNNLLY